jgi:hypothetical protein
MMTPNDAQVIIFAMTIGIGIVALGLLVFATYSSLKVAEKCDDELEEK